MVRIPCLSGPMRNLQGITNNTIARLEHQSLIRDGTWITHMKGSEVDGRNCQVGIEVDTLGASIMDISLTQQCTMAGYDTYW